MREQVKSKPLLQVPFVVLWLAIWELMAAQFQLLPSILDVLRAMLAIITETSSIAIFILSFFKITVTFTIAAGLGIILSEMAASNRYLNSFFNIPLQVLKTIPVAILSLIFLFFLPAASLLFWIPLAVVLPIYYTQNIHARELFPECLSELQVLYCVPLWRKFRYSYLVQRFPHWNTAFLQSYAFSIKAGVAAEIISLSSNSLGEMIYDAKLYLDLARLLAITVWIIFFSKLLEKVIQYCLKRLYKKFLGISKSYFTKVSPTHAPEDLHNDYSTKCITIELRNMSFGYGNSTIFKTFNLTLSTPNHYLLAAPTGRGKTSLARLLLGLEKPNSGTITWEGVESAAYIPQQTCFLEEATVLNNLRMLSNLPDDQLISFMHYVGLDIELQNRPVVQLSGGMKQQLALACALTRRADVLILDEPFSSMDVNLAQSLSEKLEQLYQARLLVLITHDSILQKTWSGDHIQL